MAPGDGVKHPQLTRWLRSFFHSPTTTTAHYQRRPTMPRHKLLAQLPSWLQDRLPSRVLCQRMFKSTVNSTIALILCLNPRTLAVLGGEPAMLPLIAVIVHPGRRLGTMLESAAFNSTGLLLGNAYALFGRFVAQKICQSKLSDVEQLESNYHRFRAALAWLAVLHILMLFFHGWMRSITHKFFSIVFPLFLVVHFTFTDDIATDAATIVQNFTIPFFLGIAISLACNLLIFPEFGSTYLGTSMVHTLTELQSTIDTAVRFFVNPDPQQLSAIVKLKDTLRAKLNATQAVLQEATYEISYAYLPPTQLKPTIDIIKTQISYTNALINACQLEVSTQGDVLRKTVERAQQPLEALHTQITRSMSLVTSAIGYCYDVKSTASSSQFDFEAHLHELTSAMAHLDIQIREEFKNLSTEADDYLSPNDEMFILSSFLMNFKETCNSVCNLLKQAQLIHEFRKEREAKGLLGRRLWVAFLTSREAMKGWYKANKADMMNETATLNGDTASKVFLGDEEAPTRKVNHHSPLSQFYETYQAHIKFGLQCAVGLTLATFPMFVPEARHWFVDIRGTWIGFVCILVVEPEIGSTFFVFFLRGVGVISGAAWGYLSYVAAVNQTNPYLEVVVTAIGAVPGYYYFLGTPYVKAAIIGIISIYIVLLSTVIPSEVGGSILQNFGKRCLAMIYGGAVALLCQVVFFPVKARDELIKEVVQSVGNISQLVLLYAAGIDGESIEMSISPKRYEMFKKLSATTKSSLIRADAYRASARREPRLKGNYDDIEKIFYEIIFILREILDRLDNIVQLRRAYGSAIIEEFNKDAYPYRRQLMASMNNTLKAVQLALHTKAPLPQYLPSSRIAHKRLIKKVTELVHSKYHISTTEQSSSSSSDTESDSDSEIIVNFRNRRGGAVDKVLKEKFLSWNASSAATEEVIQYIEELMELTKVLVGVNEFKYGFLSRSLYSDYAAQAARGFHRAMHTQDTSDDESLNDEEHPVAFHDDDESVRSAATGISKGFRKRVYSFGSWIKHDDTKSLGQVKTNEEDDIPLSLMKVVSRKTMNDE